MANKTTYAYEVIRIVRRLAEMADIVDERHQAFFDNQFQSGGANEIVDGDLTDFSVSAADFTAGITLLEQFKNFKNNAAVTQADYLATMNKLRDGHSG